ncbi:MAG: S-formylglutathione hydrolase [Deltaproteobacteria bacterium]|nr:S-formylglutathione hydrolase [Deltaproteobacteria bacterium]
MTNATVRSEHAAFGGTQGFYERASEACAGPMRFSVFLPPQAKSAKVPALYYLAGLTCNDEHLPTKGGAQALAAELGLALVACDTSPRSTRYPGDDASWDFGLGAGFYLDATEAPWSASYRMETHVTRELVSWVEEDFPIASGRRGIFGHSMGGHGALTLALRHPKLFASASAFAPIVAPSRVPWGEKAFSGYLGHDRSRWAEHDACELVRTRPRADLELFVDQGTSDKFLERELQPSLLEAACASSSQRLTLRRHAGYDHSYYFIATFMNDHLRHHAKALRP